MPEKLRRSLWRGAQCLPFLVAIESLSGRREPAVSVLEFDASLYPARRGRRSQRDARAAAARETQSGVPIWRLHRIPGAPGSGGEVMREVSPETLQHRHQSIGELLRCIAHQGPRSGQRGRERRPSPQVAGKRLARTNTCFPTRCRPAGQAPSDSAARRPARRSARLPELQHHRPHFLQKPPPLGSPLARPTCPLQPRAQPLEPIARTSFDELHLLSREFWC